MRHIVVGTAGHVDHGKTALVLALTGVETDRLPEEQRRGITIELGFAPWRLSDELMASIIDAPGHRRLVHTMIAGAAGIDLVLLVVAADEGVMPQTREHVAACKLLGVRRAVVAINKADRVEPELAELASEEALELLAAHGIAATAVACSAKTGQGVDAVRRAVVETIGLLEPRADRPHARLWIDRAFTVHGSGTVVTGTLVEGGLAVGDALRIVGPERELAASARALHVHGAAVERIAAPTRLAINVAIAAGQARGAGADVGRGDLVTTDPDIVPTRTLDVMLQAEGTIRRGSVASVFLGTSRSTARVQPLDPAGGVAAASIAAGQRVPARLRLASPLVAAGGDRFVLRGANVDGPVGAVVGGGGVVDAHPPRHRASKRAPLLLVAAEGDARKLVLGLVEEASPHALLRASLRSRYCLPAEALEQAARELVRDGALVKVQAVGWTSAASLDRLAERALALVAAHHQAAPLEPGLRLQTLREQLGAVAGPESTTELLSRLASSAGVKAGGAAGKAEPGAGKKADHGKGKRSERESSAPTLVIDGDVVRLSTFGGAGAEGAASEAVAATRAILREAGLQGVTENAVARACGDAKQAKALLALLVRSGGAVKAADLWFDAEAIRLLRAQITAHLASQGKLTIQEFKTMTGLGRRQTIPLLEYFDREKVTRRQGDDRLPGTA